MPKFYISEFYIKNSLLSFLGLIVIAAIAIFIIDNIDSSYLYLGFSFAIFIAIIGTTIIGYYNAASSSKKEGKPLLLHIFLMTLLFIMNSIWGESSILTNLLRELFYLIFLQFGVYLFTKKKC